MIALLNIMPLLPIAVGSVAAYAAYVRWGREPEPEPDYLALLPMANDLRERVIRYQKISRKITLLENNETGDVHDTSGVSLSWASPAGADGTICVDIPDGGEVAEEFLSALLVQTGEQLEETVLYILKWYQTNVGTLPPLPKEEYKRQWKFRRSPPNVRKTILGKIDGRPQNYFSVEMETATVDEELYRLAWRRHGDLRWHVEGYATPEEQAARQVELELSLGKELAEETIPPGNKRMTAEKFNKILKGGLAR